VRNGVSSVVAPGVVGPWVGHPRARLARRRHSRYQTLEWKLSGSRRTV